MSYLTEIGHPVIGADLSLGFQSTGENNRVITRRYKCPAVDYAKHVVSLINPTLTDPVIPTAYIVHQSVSGMGEVDCILTRTFAEVPTEWNDYDDTFVTFPGCVRVPAGEREMLWRNAPVSLRAIVRINRRYFLSNPKRIPRIQAFGATDQVGNSVSTLTVNTVPSNEEYAAMVLAAQEICVSSKISRWKGDIWCRETLYAAAQ